MPNARFERINIDIAGPFPSSNGYTHVLVCIDPFTRWTEAFPMPDMSTASVIQNLNLHVQTFGAPVEIHSDAGSNLHHIPLKIIINFLEQLTESAVYVIQNQMDLLKELSELLKRH